jgi:hypothetical protein
MENRPSLDIEFGQNLKNFIPELFARLLIMLFVIVGLKSVGDDQTQHVFFIILFLVLNVILFLLTLYGTNRRKISILNFIEMRLKVDEKFGNCQINYSSNFNNTAFYFYVTLSAVVFFISLVTLRVNAVFPLFNNQNFLFILPALFLTFVYGLVLRYFRMNFISKGIVAVTLNGHKFSQDEVKEFMVFLYDEKQEEEGYYVNDSLLHDIERNANIYKQRIETLLIEAVFIGALTFGTYIQLTSPESIGSFREIDEIEMKANGLDLDSISRNKYITDFDTLLLPVKSEKMDQVNYDANESVELDAQAPPLTKINLFEQAYTLTKSTHLFTYVQRMISQEKRDSLHQQGIFQDWALQRHYNIFRYFYKKKDSIPELFKIDNINKDDLEEEIFILKKQLILERNKIIQYDSLLSDSLIAAANLSVFTTEIAKQLIRKIDQQKLNDIFKAKRDSIYDLVKEERAEVLRILYRHDRQKFMKYYCISKSAWDEQEYLFLIAIGSIICSVLYISVLINRFVIILKIETLFSEINKAMAWNRREEDALANEMRAQVEGSSQVIYEKFESKRKYYTEKLQIQLAKCSQLGTKIETNIQVATFVRNIGLYTFFVVLLVGTMMLDPKFTFVLSFILLYAMVGSAFMQEGSNIRSIWHRFSRHDDHEH